MKKITLFIVSILIVTTAFSQRPSRKIEKAFEAQYPNAQDTKWENDEGDRTKYKDIIWRVRYTIDGKEMASDYDYHANWIMTILLIEIDDLPEAIKTTIAEEYSRSTISVAAKLEEPGLSSYAAVMNDGDLVYKVQFSKEGKILRRKYSAGGL